jgi:hypothetical protein
MTTPNFQLPTPKGSHSSEQGESCVSWLVATTFTPLFAGFLLGVGSWELEVEGTA